MKIGILSVQGAFIEHEKKINSLGIECVQLRKEEDLLKDFNGLILPGGESTVQGKLLRELKMFDTIKNMIQDGMPTFATCAGLILLASKIQNDERIHLGTLPVTVERNAYGRQLGSFFTNEDFGNLGKVPMSFIRAPIISKTDKDVEILSTVKEKIVAVKYKNQIAISFHPELNSDSRIHKFFLETVKKA